MLSGVESPIRHRVKPSRQGRALAADGSPIAVTFSNMSRRLKCPRRGSTLGPSKGRQSNHSLEDLHMARILYVLVTLFAVAGLDAFDGSALAQPKDKGQMEQGDGKGKKEGKEQKVKAQKHHNGKDLVGDKIKTDGKHEFHKNGKNTAFVDVKGGKVAGVSVKNADKGDVPVKKYKTTKKMAEAPASGIQPVSLMLAQAQYLGTIYIGYAYIDEFGDEDRKS